MSEEKAAQLAEMAIDMSVQPDLATTLDRICRNALQASTADAAGIFLVRGRKIRTVAVTEPAVVEIEQIQAELHQGPCLDTIWDQSTLCVVDMRTETRWPEWAAWMVEHGWLSGLSVRLSGIGDRTVGSLNLFTHREAGFDDDDLDTVQIFSRHASVALANARQETALQEAVSARHLIGMAQGILMQRYGIDQNAAFEALKRHSQQGNVKLHAVAAHVLAHRSFPTAPTQQAS